jgi:hypothetical protein
LSREGDAADADAARVCISLPSEVKAGQGTLAGKTALIKV